jgi:hypothetical protein
VALFLANVQNLPLSRANLDLPIVRRLALRPDFQAAVRVLDARLADQRHGVLQLLCSPDHVAGWQTAPETCSRLKGRPERSVQSNRADH